MGVPARVAVLLVCGAVAVACHRPAADPAPPAAPPAVSNQSAIFFPGPRDVVGLELSAVDRDRLGELYALRQIDPCGFVDQQALVADGHESFSYNYSAMPAIVYGGASPVQPIGGEGCRIAFPGNETGLSIELWPGEPRWNDDQFQPEPAHPGVEHLQSSCQYRVRLPLAGLTGAPPAMRDPSIAVTPVKLADGHGISDDTAACRLAETMADRAAVRVKDRGVPVHADRDTTAARFLTSDPCAAAPDVDAVGLIWHESPPVAQWPTTWRHPGVCNLRLGGPDPNYSSAVIRRGLAVWSDDIVSSGYGDAQSGERDGMTLLTVAPTQANGCSRFVVVKAGAGMEPTRIGPGAPAPTAVTPVVTITLNGPTNGIACTDVVQQAAVDIARKALAR